LQPQVIKSLEPILQPPHGEYQPTGMPGSCPNFGLFVSPRKELVLFNNSSLNTCYNPTL
jgi:hypothetical protein